MPSPGVGANSPVCALGGDFGPTPCALHDSLVLSSRTRKLLAAYEVAVLQRHCAAHVVHMDFKGIESQIFCLQAC